MADRATLTCRRCGFDKPLAEMKRDTRYANGYSSYCRLCHTEQTKTWQRANRERNNATRKRRYHRKRDVIRAQRKARYDPERERWASLARLYKITREQYGRMFEAQSGLCAICHSPPGKRPLFVDHSHHCCPRTPTCGQCTRGLLCGPCNFSLHALEHREGWLERAAAYLGAHR